MHENNQLTISSEKAKSYKEFVESVSPKTSLIKSLLLAFVFGGLVCSLGQLAADILNKCANVELEVAKAWALVILIGLTVLATGIGVYDDISRYSGAGTFLPISGFANAVASAAVEFKSEGFIFGLGAKMFTIAGPVIVNGIVWSTVVAIIHLIIYKIS